jgi:hypothetical protein
MTTTTMTTTTMTTTTMTSTTTTTTLTRATPQMMKPMMQLKQLSHLKTGEAKERNILEITGQIKISTEKVEKRNLAKNKPMRTNGLMKEVRK